MLVPTSLDRRPRCCCDGACSTVLWSFQRRFDPLHNSSVTLQSRKERLLENMALFDFTLSETQMEALNTLDAAFRYCWDPSKVL